MHTEYEVRILGLDKSDIVIRDLEKIYLDYGYNLNEIYELKLEEERK